MEQTDFSLARPGKVSTEITLYGAKVTLCKVQPVSKRKSLPSLPPSSLSLLSWGVHSWLIPGGVWNGHLAFGWECVSSFGLRYIAQLGTGSDPTLAWEEAGAERACLASYEVHSSCSGPLTHSASEPQFPSYLSFVREDMPSSDRCSLSTTES